MGEEIAPLFVWADVPDEDVADIEGAALPAYLEGLRDAGADVDPGVVWLGYAATAVLRYSFVCTAVAVRAGLQSQGMASGAAVGDDVRERTVTQNAGIVRFLLNLADRVRATLP